MPFYSISVAIPGRVGEPKTAFNEGELEPVLGEAIELRVDTDAYSDKLFFWTDLERLLQRMREQAEPRPEFAPPVATGAVYLPGVYVAGVYE